MNRHGRLAALVLLLLPSVACSGGTKYIGAHAEAVGGSGGGAGSGGGVEAACAAPGPPPAALELDPFYAKYTSARGVPVMSSASVSDLALERACDTAIHVLEARADVHARLVENGLRVVVIARSEVMTDIPEYRDIYGTSPGIDWDTEARGTGPSPDGHLASAGEENLLCLDDDRFAGEALLVFSLGHALRSLGLLDLDPEWGSRLRTAYEAATSAGLWVDTHAATSAAQYWAEGVQDWYDANREAVPGDGVHNEINTREELKAYDPELAALIAESVPEDDWRPVCLADR